MAAPIAWRSELSFFLFKLIFGPKSNDFGETEESVTLYSVGTKRRRNHENQKWGKEGKCVIAATVKFQRQRFHALMTQSEACPCRNPLQVNGLHALDVCVRGFTTGYNDCDIVTRHLKGQDPFCKFGCYLKKKNCVYVFQIIIGSNKKLFNAIYFDGEVELEEMFFLT